MVRKLELALYAEGSTDYLFLPPIIARTAQDILTQAVFVGTRFIASASVIYHMRSYIR